MSIDTNGIIYILDNDNARVTRWASGDLNGTIIAGGNGNGYNITQLSSPQGMFIEFQKSVIWIADTGNHRIVTWKSPSTGVFVCGNYGVGAKQFNYPQGLFVDAASSNAFYVADTYNHRIQMWLFGSTSGQTVAGETAISSDGLNRLSYPSTLIVDNSKIMYIVDTGNNRIMQWIIGSTSGIVVAGISTHGNLPNQLQSPRSIKFDQSGALIVVDTLNSRIQKFSVLCGKFKKLST